MNQLTVVPKVEIIFPEDEKVRSRKVVKRSNARNTGKYPSWKMKRMMQWESVHEGNAMRILDATPNVVSFSEQPCEIKYVLNGVERRHYPDFIVIEGNQLEFWEVKTQSDANSQEVAERTAFLTKALLEYGYSYRVVLAEVLGKQPRLDNIKRLNKLGRQPISPLEQERIRRLFLNEPIMTWGAFEQQSQQILRSISHLILQGKLSIDFNQRISPATLIRSNFNAEL